MIQIQEEPDTVEHWLPGHTYRDPRFSSDAGHASHALEAHGARGARDAIYAAGAVGALDALRAQLPATAGLEGNRSREGVMAEPPAGASPLELAVSPLLTHTSDLHDPRGPGSQCLPGTHLSFGANRAAGTLEKSRKEVVHFSYSRVVGCGN